MTSLPGHFEDLGTAPFEEVWARQQQFFDAALARKVARRRAGLEGAAPGPVGREDLALPDHHLLFVEHPHVLTLGKSGDPGNVLATPERLAALGVTYFPINRGGDVTYHGPGQLVGYPILDLEQLFTDIGRYMRTLEEAIILTCADYGLETRRIEGLTGVWLDGPSVSGMAPRGERKIAALGVKCSRWVTMHGFAFNVSPNLAYFDLIVPCGIQNRSVTSLQLELGRPVPMAEVKDRVRAHLSALLGIDFAPLTRFTAP